MGVGVVVEILHIAEKPQAAAETVLLAQPVDDRMQMRVRLQELLVGHGARGAHRGVNLARFVGELLNRRPGHDLMAVGFDHLGHEKPAPLLGLRDHLVLVDRDPGLEDDRAALVDDVEGEDLFAA